MLCFSDRFPAYFPHIFQPFASLRYFAMGANLRGATNADAADSHGASNGATAAEPAPRWLKTVRSAVALPAPAEVRSEEFMRGSMGEPGIISR